ncbi:hypothetical protein FS749_001454 [Ceratobasidium sp. UAMH 11750]|nr:hypothetical protein FS749_001454 [Ceratobasidium sp. UAMH 11750]
MRFPPGQDMIELQPGILINQPEDLTSPLTPFPLYCVFTGPWRGCWRDYGDIVRIKKVFANFSSFAKVYTKTEAEWTLKHAESFKMLLATSIDIGEFRKKLEGIFAGREDIMIGSELQKSIYDHAGPFAPVLVSPTPSPTPVASLSSDTETTYPSQSSQPSQVDCGHTYGAFSCSPSSPTTQSTQGFSRAPVWPQHQTSRPLRTIVKGSVANVLRRHGVMEEATRRFRSFQALESGTMSFELDVAYEVQTKLRAHIRQLEEDMFGTEGGQ